MNSIEYPIVSLIIPTFNAEKYLENCLRSIFKQNYPKDKYEVIIVDDNSTDSTITIAKQYPVIILENGNMNPEIGKSIGLQKSKGDFIYFGDADVILDDSDWLRNMIKPLVNHKSIFAVECNWGILDDFSTINSYVALLGIADPLARMLCNRKPAHVDYFENYQIWEFNINQNPILYCVIWRKESILKIKRYKDIFLEGGAPTQLLSLGYKHIAHVDNTKAYHYYVESFGDYFIKRKKIARKFLNRRRNNEKVWVDARSKLHFILCVAYLSTLIGPTLESCYYILKQKRKEWLWHPIVGLLTIVTYMYYYINFLRRYK